MRLNNVTFFFTKFDGTLKFFSLRVTKIYVTL